MLGSVVLCLVMWVIRILMWVFLLKVRLVVVMLFDLGMVVSGGWWVWGCFGFLWCLYGVGIVGSWLVFGLVFFDFLFGV